MNAQQTIIRLDHYYSKNHALTARFIETSMTLNHLIDVVACLQFAFEIVVDETLPMDERHITSLLEQFFDATDVTENYQSYHAQLALPDEEWALTNQWTLRKDDGELAKITQIDLYGARESRCGPHCKTLMSQVLPNTTAFWEAVDDGTYYE